MAKFLSEEYIVAANAALSASDSFQSAITNVNLSMQFHVTDGPEGDIDYSIAIADGSAEIALGQLDGAEVTVTNDYETAVGISTGEVNTQMAFMTGKVKVDGNMAALLMNQNVLNQLTSVLSSVDVDY